MPLSCDIIVIGAGIAGISIGAELAASAKVKIIEMEAQAGFHASGRSAAFYAKSYGNKVVRGMTAASEHFFRSPPDGFTEVDLLRDRYCVFFAREEQKLQLHAMQEEIPSLQFMNAEEIRQLVPILKEESLYGALCDCSGGDLDVDAILHGYLRLFRRRSGELITAETVISIEAENSAWRVRTNKAEYSAAVVINAAGAWADSVAELANLAPLGLIPKRRTALLIDTPGGVDTKDWPLSIDIDEQFYFKPDAGQLLISPADETPSAACDAQAEELDVAMAVDRFEIATGLEVKRVNHRWAGLRTFAEDKTFIAGYDPRTEGFFWLAGQGGYGVQSAPGMAQLGSSLVNGIAPEKEFSAVLDHTNAVSPQRLIAKA